MTITALPETAWKWILLAEGVAQTNDPVDHGGATRYGISKANHPTAWTNGPPSAEQARAIYDQDYWATARCGEIPPEMGIMLFDLMVQHPPQRAVKIWQRCLGVRADGIIGETTVAAALRADPAALTDRYYPARALYYHAISLSEPSQARFIQGWFGRLFRLQRFLHDHGQ